MYGLCQLSSRHALAYTTGSVWSTLELHGNYSVDELKRHCDVHLVFLEGGILGQLHKKPKIPRLMGSPSSIKRTSVVIIDDAKCDTVETKQTPGDTEFTWQHTVSKPSTSVDTTDHTYALPTPHVLKDTSTNNVENTKQQQQHANHTYAELSDVPTELYGSESDSQNDVVTTGSKFIISRSDKVEISLEYQCSTSLPEATNEGTGSTETVTPTVTLSDDATMEFPDET